MKTLSINKIPTLFQQLFNRKALNNEGKPITNIADEEKAFELSVAIPGFDKKEIDLSIDNNYLIIKAEKNSEHNDETKYWIRREFVYNKFYRTFTLPENANFDKVNAELKNGILTITIAKKSEENSNKRLITVR